MFDDFSSLWVAQCGSLISSWHVNKQHLISWMPYLSMACIFTYILSFGMGPGQLLETFYINLLMFTLFWSCCLLLFHLFDHFGGFRVVEESDDEAHCRNFMFVLSWGDGRPAHRDLQSNGSPGSLHDRWLHDVAQPLHCWNDLPFSSGQPLSP